MTRPVERIVNDGIVYNTNNNIYLIIDTISNVKSNKITPNHLHISNNVRTFAVDKGTFVLLTIKELKLWLM